MAKAKSGKRANNEGSLFELADGRWRAQVSIGGGKYATRTRATQEAALAALKELNAEQSTGVVTSGALTVGDIIDMWLTRDLPDEQWSDGEKYSARNECRHWKDAIGSMKVARVGALHIEDAMRKMRKRNGKPYSRETLTKRRAFLGQVWDAAIRRKIVTPYNPVRIARLPGDAVAGKRRDALTAEQARLLIRHTSTRRNGAAFLVGCSLGLRPGELFGMTWKSLDLKAGTLHIFQTVNMTTGVPFIQDSTKTEGSTRTLSLPAFVVAALVKHRDEQRAAMLEGGWRTDLVFPKADGSPMDLGQFRDEFRDACAALGFGQTWTPNQMRHTAATLLADSGMSPAQIADVLGHTSDRMVRKHYRNSKRDVKTAHVAAMDGLFGVTKGRAKKTS